MPNSSQSAGVHYGANRRRRNVRRAGTTHQPPRALSSQPRAQAPRSLRHLHGEQRPLCRKLRRGRARGALLHLRQLVSDRRRARLHRQQQRIQSPNCIRRDSRDRPHSNRPVPEGRSRAGGGRLGRRRPYPQSRRGPPPAFPPRRLQTRTMGTAMSYSSGTNRQAKRYSPPIARPATVAAIAAV